MVVMGKGYYCMSCMNHGLGSFTRAQWWGIVAPNSIYRKSKRSFDHSPSRCQWLFVWSRTSDVTQLYFIHLGLRAEEGIVYWNLLQLLQGPLFAVKNCAI
jgi:hypothetical protein